jgi:glucose-6-phosphate-specific signal transduction histidine kinase
LTDDRLLQVRPRKSVRSVAIRAPVEISAIIVPKYANASHAWVTVERRNAHLAVEIGDDGVGGVDPTAGSGLEGLRDCIAAVDGTLEITSSRREGTILRAHLPVSALVS